MTPEVPRGSLPGQWTADAKLREAINEHGFKITWARNKHGLWFNAFTPQGKHIEGGYDKEAVIAACEAHREMLAKQRAMWAAREASTEVVV